MNIIDTAHSLLTGRLPGSQVTNPSGQATAMDPAEENRLRDQEYAAWQAQQADHSQQLRGGQGFMANMGFKPHGELAAFGTTPSAMPAAPPSGWAYQPGKGASWMTPQRTINGGGPSAQSQNWSYSVSPTGNPFTGNRI